MPDDLSAQGRGNAVLTKEQILAIAFYGQPTLKRVKFARDVERAVVAQLGLRERSRFNAGMIGAAAIVVSVHDRPNVARDIINALGKEWWVDGSDDDLAILRPHFPEIPGALAGRQTN